MNPVQPGLLPERGPQNAGICIRRWFFDRKEIQLIRKPNTLECLVIDQADGRRLAVDIPIPNDLTVEQMVTHLLECEPELRDDGIPIFSKPLVCITRARNNREISLLQRKEFNINDPQEHNFMWRRLDKVAKTSYRILADFTKTLSVKDRITYYKDFLGQDDIALCFDFRDFSFNENPPRPLSFQSRSVFQATTYGGYVNTFDPPILAAQSTYDRDILRTELTLHHIKPEDRLVWQLYDRSLKTSYIFDENMARDTQGDNGLQDPVNTVTYLRNFDIDPTLFDQVQFNTVSLVKKTEPSRLDSTVMVSGAEWALTVINTNDSWEGHAQLIVEGMEKGEYFMSYAHLVAGQGPENRERSSSLDNPVVNLATTVVRTTVPGIIKYKERVENLEQIRWPSDKTVTWVRGRGMVKRMLQRIGYNVKDQIERRRTVVHFNMLGRNAGFENGFIVQSFESEQQMLREMKHWMTRLPYKLEQCGSRWNLIKLPHNCITWAIEKLKEVYIDWNPQPEVDELPKWPSFRRINPVISAVANVALAVARPRIATVARIAIKKAPQTAKSYDECRRIELTDGQKETRESCIIL
jgi:hypothetical protein